MLNEFINTNEDFIFFSNFKDNKKLYRMDKQFNLVKLSDHSSKFINVKGNWIYFLDETKWYIIKIKTDGSCEETIYENGVIDELILYDNYALFTEFEDLVRLDLNSYEIKKFHLYTNRNRGYGVGSSPFYNIILNNGKLFFTEDFRKIYNFPIDSFEKTFCDGYKNLLALENTTFEELKEKARQSNIQINDISDVEAIIGMGAAIPLIYGEDNVIKKTNNVLDYVIKEKYIYYVKAQSSREVEWAEFPIYCGNLYRVDLSNNFIRKIVYDNVFSLYATEDLVAYINADDNYKLTLQGLNFKKVIDIENIININGIRDKIYFYDKEFNLYEIALENFKVTKLV